MSKLNPVRARAYKVCFDEGDGVLKSAEYASRQSKYGLTYPTDGSLVRPVAGKIFVFDDLAKARDYAGLSAPVWEVEAYGLRRATIRPRQSVLNDEGLMSDVWELWHSKGTFGDYNRTAYYGTCYCNSLRMIKKV